MRRVLVLGAGGMLGHKLVQVLSADPELEVVSAAEGALSRQRALVAGAKEHGASVHFVTSELDGGPIIVQARVPVKKDDDADSLAARVLEREHVIYPQAIRWFAEGRLKIAGGQALLDGKPSLGRC